MSNESEGERKRDLEKERQELLDSIGKNMPTGLQDRIQAAIDAAAIAQDYEIVSSEWGSSDADNQ